MKKLVYVFAFVLIAVLAVAGFAKKEKVADMGMDEITVSGYIVDNMCASGHTADRGTFVPTPRKNARLCRRAWQAGMVSTLKKR